MSPVLYAAVLASIIGYLMLLHAGINGLRISRMLGLRWAGYIWFGGVWIWIALIGFWNMWATVNKVRLHGRPQTVIYASGFTEQVAMGGRQWVGLVGGFVLCVFLWTVAYIVHRNMKYMDAAERAEITKTKMAVTRLSRTLEAKDAGK